MGTHYSLILKVSNKSHLYSESIKGSEVYNEIRLSVKASLVFISFGRYIAVLLLNPREIRIS